VDYGCSLIAGAMIFFERPAHSRPFCFVYLIHPVANADASSAWPLCRAKAAIASWS
jgi:hypothetical protein